MVLNLKYGTLPFLAHAPGKLNFIPLWDKMQSRLIKVEKPDDVEVITFNNGGIGHNGKINGLLERQIPCTKLGCGIQSWRNSMKIELLHNHLLNNKSNFVLISDSSDVFVLRPLNRMIDFFLSFKCDAVFNMEKQFWPQDMDSSFEAKLGPGFLNAGLWISYRSFAIELVQALHSELNICYSNSEQRIFKRVFPNFHPRILIDYESKLFQGLNRIDSELSFINLY